MNQGSFNIEAHAFHLSPDEIVNTPSRKDGVSAQIEMEQRIYGCESIQRAGILLRLPQFVMVTAQVFLHRFYYRCSLKKQDIKDTAMACLFLATKSEEVSRKLRDICNVFWRMNLRERGLSIEPLDVYTQDYWEMKETITEMEQILLRALGYVVQVVQPHKFLLNYLKILDGSQELMQKAWNFANDSMRSVCCVLYPPESIAVTAIYLAARSLQIALPESPEPWWQLFDVTWTDIEGISRMILFLYQQPLATYQCLVLSPSQEISTVPTQDSKAEEVTGPYPPTSHSEPQQTSEEASYTPERSSKSHDDEHRRHHSPRHRDDRERHRSSSRERHRSSSRERSSSRHGEKSRSSRDDYDRKHRHSSSSSSRHHDERDRHHSSSRSHSSSSSSRHDSHKSRK